MEYRDVLDDMVLKLLDKETLGKDEVAEIFADVPKRPERLHPTGNGRRPLSSKPPVLTPAELAVMGPADLEDLARGRAPGGERKAASGRERADAVNREALTAESGQPDQVKAPRAPRTPRRATGTDPAS